MTKNGLYVIVSVKIFKQFNTNKYFSQTEKDYSQKDHYFMWINQILYVIGEVHYHPLESFIARQNVNLQH